MYKNWGHRNFRPGKGPWASGAILFVLALGVCFTGYVLVFGQMSFWALVVILNLVTVLPVVDALVILALYGATYPVDWALGRMFVLHFALGVVALGMAAIHVVFVHRAKPGGAGFWGDSNLALGDVLVKDMALLGLLSLTLASNYLDYLVHPDNFGGLSRLSTPAHIEPEIYFLYIFGILKARASKPVGVLSIVNIFSVLLAGSEVTENTSPSTAARLRSKSQSTACPLGALCLEGKKFS